MFKSKQPIEPALQRTKDLLFPQFDIVEGDNGKYLIDYSVDMNLESVIADIEDNAVDMVTVETLKKVVAKLTELRTILGVEQKAPPSDVKFYTVLPERGKMKDL